MNIPIKLSNGGSYPTSGHPDDAGIDLYSTEDFEIMHGERKLFKTGVQMQIPQGFYGRIAPRSSLAYKHGINVLGGVIDSTYRGDIGVILHNTGDPYEIKKGDRIAQIIITPCVTNVSFTEREEDETERGEGGFGSTGL